MQQQKLVFIQNDLFILLKQISADTKPAWGKMNAQQMVEHLVGFFNVSIEKLQFPLVTSEEHLPKYLEFLYSETTAFKENTKAPASVLGDDTLPVRYDTYEKAVEKLHSTVADFVEYFKHQSNKKTLHPVFGYLTFDEWVMLHYKHVTHHLRQFGIAC